MKALDGKKLGRQDILSKILTPSKTSPDPPWYIIIIPKRGMRSRSYKFTGKVVPPTAGPVPPATWNRGNSHVLRSRRGPAAVPPIVIAYFRTRKHCQVYCRVRHGIVVIPTFRCPPAAVPPRGIAWVPTQKQHQVFAGTW